MPSNVYYSVSPYGTGDVKTGSPTIEIAAGVATLSVAQTGNIGVGCCIDFGAGNTLIYIAAVNSATSFDVVTATGGTPSNVSPAETVNSIHHEYASLNAAEAGYTDANHVNNTDLTTADVLVNLACYYDHDDDTADGTAVTLDGATTDSTRYVRIYTPQGGTESINDQRHEGKWTASRYALDVTATVLDLGDDYAEVVGLQIRCTSASTYRKGIYLRTSAPDNVTIDRNLVVGNGVGGASEGIVLDGSGHTVSNNVIYGWNGYGCQGYYDDGNCLFANNTLYANGVYGLLLDSSGSKVVNTIAYGHGTKDFYGGEPAGSDYNFSEDDTAPGANSIHGASDSKTPDFVDTGSGTEDFHLQSTSDAIGTGVGPSSDSDVPTLDIDGDTRSGATTDIGADLYVAAGPSGANTPWHLLCGRAA